eukprot:CAMPEP_0181140830 /NCGR_PEP_ID=MMETSP1071-20121207/35507_1 /TAXON_ID=35127 /ORGANISM="Thalassiosira sp., Strain NH16" /LENGTH=785 /DNA_ID=CAMNT_0023227795 /DNA_START=193 /DNA_END=2550 /DNA_ORIENTATION=+
MATNGGGIPSGRLPPQAPSSRHRVGSNDVDADNPNRPREHHGSRRSKKNGGRRVRSSSDGVRQMNERYQQQQQQQQQQYYSNYGYQQQQSGNNYPMQYSNQPPSGYGGPPPGPPPPGPPRGHRTGSFDANSGGAPFGMDPNGAPNYGSIPPRPRTGSKEFNAMGELSSVIGRSPAGGGNVRGSSPRNARRGNHRRTMSDSMAMPHQQPVQMPPLPEGPYGNNPVVMPNPNYPTGRGRADSFGSQGSYHSHHAPPMPMGAYPGGGEEFAGEMDAILARHNNATGAPAAAGGGYKSGRPKMHMRQHSVNLYMKSFKGQEQPRSCKDVLFGALFVLQLVIMCVVGLKFGPEALVATAEELGPGEGENDDAPVDIIEDVKIVLAYQNIVKMAYTCGAFAVIVSALALAFMMAMSRRLVYVALVLSIGVSFAWGTIGIGISPKSFVPITGIIALMLTVGYMFVVWDRIPFASANLTTALTGVRDNLGLVGVAFFFQLLALVCSIYYSFTFVGLHDAMHNGDLFDLSDRAMYTIDFLLFVSFYWTYQVLRHIVMVTVAGTIGSWWFAKPSALYQTFLSATVYNFGSICYGSLFVGFVQFLRQITEGLRPHSEDSSMMCLVECSLFFQTKIVGCVDNLADSFTPWAFTYVGLYKYGLKEAGHKSNELFDQRGWTRIVNDDLISSVLAMVSLVIGGLTGSFAVILQALDGHGLTSFGHPVLTSFTIGFLVGIVLSTVLFSIIDSSVCAVIVCFAGSPVEFHRNHPTLSNEMRHAWKEVWPGSLDIDNMGAGLV